MMSQVKKVSPRRPTHVTPAATNPFNNHPLVGFEGMSAPERHRAQLNAVAFLRFIGFREQANIVLKEVGSTPHETPGGCRFDNLGKSDEKSILITFLERKKPEVTVTIETGFHTSRLMSYLPAFVKGNKTIPRKQFLGWIETITKELAEFEKACIIPMKTAVQKKPRKPRQVKKRKLSRPCLEGFMAHFDSLVTGPVIKMFEQYKELSHLGRIVGNNPRAIKCLESRIQLKLEHDELQKKRDLFERSIHWYLSTL